MRVLRLVVPYGKPFRHVTRPALFDDPTGIDTIR